VDVTKIDASFNLSEQERNSDKKKNIKKLSQIDNRTRFACHVRPWGCGV
jgi:hypothetical protein